MSIPKLITGPVRWIPFGPGYPPLDLAGCLVDEVSGETLGYAHTDDQRDFLIAAFRSLATEHEWKAMVAQGVPVLRIGSTCPRCFEQVAFPVPPIYAPGEGPLNVAALTSMVIALENEAKRMRETLARLSGGTP